MKVAEADILIVPSVGGSGPDHWQSRWEAKLSTARRVEQADWGSPEPEEWSATLASAVNAAAKPVVLVAHSLGIPTVMRALPQLRARVAGAFLAAPPDVGRAEPTWLADFGPYPRDPLPFPSVTVGSRDDPYCGFEVAEDIAAAWGSLFVDAGHAGHINVDAGYGPWPEGSMLFARFLSRLEATAGR